MLSLPSSEIMKPNGLVMVKPHAVNRMLDPLIGEMLSGNLNSQFLTDDPFPALTDRIELASPVIRDLRVARYGRALLNLFYHDKSDRRYFPLIQEQYLGRVVFLPIRIDAKPHEMKPAFDAIKGTTQTYDSSGNICEAARGIRGFLGEPYQYFTNVEADLFDNVTYRKNFLPVVNNFIHVCDSTDEVEQALAVIDATA